MTPRQVDLVQTTWEKCVPIADQAAALFYEKLFELDPSLKPMFKSDIIKAGQQADANDHRLSPGTARFNALIKPNI